jgi:hypothetical protein
MAFFDRFTGKGGFPLPQFRLTPLEFEPEAKLALDEVADNLQAAEPAVRLVHAAPTAGELRASIERHLQSNQRQPRRADAAEELRSALADLRRSLR